MKTLLVLLIFSTVCLTACGKPAPQSMQCQAVYQKCPAPAWPPAWPARFDNATHMGAAANQEATAKDINFALWFLQEQRNTITCYERQANQ